MPSSEEDRAGGRPCQRWLNLFLLTHRADAEGWLRLEWPDGGPLLAQPWIQVAAFRVIEEELNKIARERTRRANAQIGRPGSMGHGF